MQIYGKYLEVDVTKFEASGGLQARKREARRSECARGVLDNIIARLRAEDGCSWDREQAHSSPKPACIEETAEVICGINILEQTGNADNLKSWDADNLKSRDADNLKSRDADMDKSTIIIKQFIMGGITENAGLYNYIRGNAFHAYRAGC